MNVSELKLLFSEFGDNVSFEVDLKKKIGSILEVRQKFFIRLKI